MILEPKKIKSLTVSFVSPSVCHEVMGPDAMILVFGMLNLNWLFHSSLTFIKRLFNSSSLSAISVVSSACQVIDISPSNVDSILCFNQPGISHDILCI